MNTILSVELARACTEPFMINLAAGGGKVIAVVCGFGKELQVKKQIVVVALNLMHFNGQNIVARNQTGGVKGIAVVSCILSAGT
jgi:hypothetical protein